MFKGKELLFRRVIAYVLDIVLLFIVLAPAAFLAEALLGLQPRTSSQIWFSAVMSFSIPAWSYFLFSDLSAGVTIGKKIMKVKIHSTNGSKITFVRALVRTSVKLLPWELAHLFGFALVNQINQIAQDIGLISANLLIIVYLIILIVTSGKRSLHDLIAQTEVNFLEADSNTLGNY